MKVEWARSFKKNPTANRKVVILMIDGSIWFQNFFVGSSGKPNVLRKRMDYNCEKVIK